MNKKPIYAAQQPRKVKMLGKCYICWLELHRFCFLVTSTNEKPIQYIKLCIYSHKHAVKT